MQSVRIGNDIKIKWAVTIEDDSLSLEDLDLHVEVRLSEGVVDWHNYEDQPTVHSHTHAVMSNGGVGLYGRERMRPRPNTAPQRPPMPPVHLKHYIEDGGIVALWPASSQFALGEYDVLLYAHRGDGGQGVADQCRFVRLVAHTAQADLPEEGDVEAVVTMQPLTLTFPGMSAYDVAVAEGFEGTKAEWLESLKEPAKEAAEEARAQGDYAKEMGDYAKESAEGVQESIENANAAAEDAVKIAKDAAKDAMTVAKEAGEEAKATAQEAADKATETAEHPTYVGTDNYVYEWDSETKEYVKTEKLVKAQPLTIDVKYASVAELEADEAEYNDGQFAMVDTGDVEDADNARLYIRKDGAWEFVVDMSGDRGETGRTPQIELGAVSLGESLQDGTATLTLAGEDEDGNPIYQLGFVIPRLTYDDLTEEQIAELQKPASDIIAEVKAAGEACAAQTELCKEATDDAEELNSHPTKQGDNGNWWRWDLETGAYVDTGVLAKGSVMYPTFEIEEEDMCLYMSYDDVAAESLVGLDADTGQLYLEY